MGGSVEVKSELGVGSEFIINIKTMCKVKQASYMFEQNQSNMIPDMLISNYNQAHSFKAPSPNFQSSQLSSNKNKGMNRFALS